MASPGQQKMRKYAYGFNGKTGYARLLKQAHTTLVKTIESYKDAEGAQKIQQFLQNIKDTARIIDEEANSKMKPDLNASSRLKKLTPEEANWYKDFVGNIIESQTNTRGKRGLDSLKGNGHFLRREHTKFYTTRDSELFDDIAEEELGYIFLEVQKKIGNDKYHIEDISSGTGKVSIAGSSAFDKIGDDLYNHFVEAFQDRAKRINQKYELGSHFTKEVRGKVDLKQGTLNINSISKINENFLKEIIPYLNNATFTVKNYKTKTFEDFGLSLGHTNFFKAIVAELNIVFPENLEGHVDYQRDIFYRGAQILTKTNEKPSASEEMVEKHFSHMRFIFELSGLGLIDKNGQPQFAKYLIFNDPVSSNIYVQDTASIILDEINKRKGVTVRLFENIHLKNVKGYKRKK